MQHSSGGGLVWLCSYFTDGMIVFPGMQENIR